MADQSQEEVAIVVVPFPAQGHLNQLLHFSLNLLSLPNSLSIHYASSPSHNRQAKHRLHCRHPQSLARIRFHDLPIPTFPTPSPDPTSPHNFPSHLLPSFEASMHLRSPLSSLLASLSASSRRLVVVHDSLMSFAGHDAASFPNAESYSFHCTPAFYGLSLAYAETNKLNMDASESALRVVSAPLDGCCPDEFWDHVERNTYDTPKQAGLIVNSCRAVEAEFLDLVCRAYVPPEERMFAVGPVNPVAISRDGGEERHGCLEWMDRQPEGSVVYVSFGSTSTVSDEQTLQLAEGLRRSGQRFVWVVRDADRGDVFLEGDGLLRKQLPEGFEEGRGIVVRGWAPQLEILSHPSTGAFVSHCGWNSCMESMSLGVPIVAWPMHSDQPRNALMVRDYLRVGVTVREWAERDRVVPSADIAETIRRVMVCDEGKEIRTRAKALGEAVRAAVAEGGTSRADLDDFVAHVLR